MSIEPDTTNERITTEGVSTRDVPDIQYKSAGYLTFLCGQVASGNPISELIYKSRAQI